MTDLSKTSGTSPPLPLPGGRARQKQVVVSHETFIAYSDAVNKFKAKYGQGAPGKQWPLERAEYLAGLEKVRAEILGNLYQPGVTVRVPKKPKAPSPFAPYKPSPELAALRRKARGVKGWLVETFPACFSYTNCKSLKLGIINDILAMYRMTDEEAYLLREAVGAYRLDHEYRKGYVLGAERVNLSGKVVGIVGDGDEEFLNDRLRADLRTTPAKHAGGA